MGVWSPLMGAGCPPKVPPPTTTDGSLFCPDAGGGCEGVGTCSTLGCCMGGSGFGGGGRLTLGLLGGSCMGVKFCFRAGSVGRSCLGVVCCVGAPVSEGSSVGSCGLEGACSVGGFSGAGGRSTGVGGSFSPLGGFCLGGPGLGGGGRLTPGLLRDCWLASEVRLAEASWPEVGSFWRDTGWAGSQGSSAGGLRSGGFPSVARACSPASCRLGEAWGLAGRCLGVGF